MVSGLGLPCPRSWSRALGYIHPHTHSYPLFDWRGRPARPAPRRLRSFVRARRPRCWPVCLFVHFIIRAVFISSDPPRPPLYTCSCGGTPCPYVIHTSYREYTYLRLVWCFPADCSNSPQMYLDLRASVRATSPSRDPNAPSLRVLLRTACANTTLCHIPPSQSDSIGRVCFRYSRRGLTWALAFAHARGEAAPTLGACGCVTQLWEVRVRVVAARAVPSWPTCPQRTYRNTSRVARRAGSSKSLSDNSRGGFAPANSAQSYP